LQACQASLPRPVRSPDECFDRAREEREREREREKEKEKERGYRRAYPFQRPSTQQYRTIALPGIQSRDRKQLPSMCNIDCHSENCELFPTIFGNLA